MSDQRILTGYAYSVYTRAVRMVLRAKGLGYEYQEVDPFAPHARVPHPFGRVPVFEHSGFQIYETQAILDYVEATWPKCSLVPTAPKSRARMRQVMGITDNYVYGAVVRQVVSQVLFAPLDSRKPDTSMIAQGMESARNALDALNDIAEEGLVLSGSSLDLADCLLWPMLDYFRAVPQGAAMLEGYPALLRWVNELKTNPIAMETAPDLKGYAS